MLFDEPEPPPATITLAYKLSSPILISVAPPPPVTYDVVPLYDTVTALPPPLNPPADVPPVVELYVEPWQPTYTYTFVDALNVKVPSE